MLNLAVIEGRWWESGNLTVRDLFETIAAALRENPDAYHYEMFNNGHSLGEVIPRVARKPQIKNLYIAAHGDEMAHMVPRLKQMKITGSPERCSGTSWQKCRVVA